MRLPAGVAAGTGTCTGARTGTRTDSGAAALTGKTPLPCASRRSATPEANLASASSRFQAVPAANCCKVCAFSGASCSTFSSPMPAPGAVTSAATFSTAARSSVWRWLALAGVAALASVKAPSVAAVRAGESLSRFEASSCVAVPSAAGDDRATRLSNAVISPSAPSRVRNCVSTTRSSTPLIARAAPTWSSRSDRCRRRTNHSVDSRARRCHSASDGVLGSSTGGAPRGMRSFCKTSNGLRCDSRLGAAGLTVRVRLVSRASTARHSLRGTGATMTTAVESSDSGGADRSIGCNASASSTRAGSSSSGTMLKSTSISAGKKFCVKSSGLMAPVGSGPALGSAGK